MTKVNNIEIRRAHSGRPYLIFYVKDESFTLGDDGHVKFMIFAQIA